MEDSTGIVFDVDMEGIRGVFADETKIKRQDGTKGEIRLLIGKNKVGKVVPIGVWIDKGWDEIGKELKETYGANKISGFFNQPYKLLISLICLSLELQR